MKSRETIMNTLKKIEFILDKILKLERDPYRKPILLLGLPRQTIIDAFGRYQLTPPNALLQIYERYNGISELASSDHFLSLEEAFEMYECYLFLKKDLALTCDWNDTYFPFFDINADVQICINLQDLSLLSIDIECDSTNIFANHYEHYLDALVEIFDMEAYVSDPYGVIEFDESEWSRLKQKYQIKDICNYLND